METLIVAIHTLVSALLILMVLIQGGEGVDISAAFGGASQAAFGPRGAVTTLAKITWVLATIFMATSITLSIMATKGSGGTILQSTPSKSAPAAPAPAPAVPATK